MMASEQPKDSDDDGAKPPLTALGSSRSMGALPDYPHASQPLLRSGSSQDGSVTGRGSFDADSSSDADTVSDPEPDKLKAHANLYQGLPPVQASLVNFAMEHRIFLKAILGLLAERDQMATEIGMNDPNILKGGPLKKASQLVSGVWKIKYAEVRRGMFSYYEDAVTGDTGALLRKNVPLDANNCDCRPVKIHRNGLNMAPGGALFELKVGTTRRLWLARSKAERLAWIQAISDAMVGRNVTQGNASEHGKSGTVNRRSPFQKDLKLYLKSKSLLRSATSKTEYIYALTEIRGGLLDVPVQWLAEQMDMQGEDPSTAAFQTTKLSEGVEQLWRDLLRDSVEINKELFHGDSGHGPEKIVGALTRYIVALSRSSGSPASRYRIPEDKAVAYARDILLSVNRTRSGGDSYFCIDTLVKNHDLIVTVPSSGQAEPLAITVEEDDAVDTSDYSMHDTSGWVLTRNRIQSSWRKRFFVLSEGTLSLYRNATPRPHGLRGQMVVTDATIKLGNSKDHPGYYTLHIETKDGLKDRWMYFKNKEKLIFWAYRLDLSTKGTSVPASVLARVGLRSPKEAKQDDTSQEDPDNALESLYELASQVGVWKDELDERIARFSAKNTSRVRISVSARTEYNLVTTDPQGDGSDVWATISATFLQRFRITGERIVRGEELVRIEVVDCPDPINFAEILNHGEDIPLSPTKRKGGRKARLSLP
eukprot:Nitzschia sp. Nitz4//scaffold58_size112336//105399//107519//NITZ4_004052-RA/size112336-processed-gene-0.96-mRNA-1//-1//CDS//3329555046//5231//frame0